MNSNIQYKGKVSVHIKNRPPLERHNEGTPELFNVLHHILSRNITYESYNLKLPAYMSIVSEFDSEIAGYLDTRLDGKRILISPVQITSRVASEEGVELKSTINKSGINFDNIPENKIVYVLLLNSSNDILAYASYSDIDFNTLQENASHQGIIRWEMSFSNETQKGGK